MPLVTPDVAWGIVRNNHAYIMKRDNCKSFSKESFNLKNIHSKKYNGFVPRRAIDIDFTKSNLGVVVKHKKSTNQYRPAKSQAKTLIRKTDRHAFRFIRRLARGGGKCRQDLEMTALARASTILRASAKIRGGKRPAYRKKADKEEKKSKKAKKTKDTKKAKSAK